MSTPYCSPTAPSSPQSPNCGPGVHPAPFLFPVYYAGMPEDNVAAMRKAKNDWALLKREKLASLPIQQVLRKIMEHIEAVGPVRRSELLKHTRFPAAALGPAIDHAIKHGVMTGGRGELLSINPGFHSSAFGEEEVDPPKTAAARNTSAQREVLRARLASAHPDEHVDRIMGYIGREGRILESRLKSHSLLSDEHFKAALATALQHGLIDFVDEPVPGRRNQRARIWQIREQQQEDPTLNAAQYAHYTTDVHGHEHAPPGPGGGQFVSAGSAGAGEAPKEKDKRLIAIAQRLPKAVVTRATEVVQKKYTQLSQRYGDHAAKAIMAEMLALTPIPVPGTSLLPVAVAEGVRQVRRLFHRRPKEEYAAYFNVKQVAQQVFLEIMRDLELELTGKVASGTQEFNALLRQQNVGYSRQTQYAEGDMSGPTAAYTPEGQAVYHPHQVDQWVTDFAKQINSMSYDDAMAHSTGIMNEMYHSNQQLYRQLSEQVAWPGAPPLMTQRFLIQKARQLPPPADAQPEYAQGSPEHTRKHQESQLLHGDFGTPARHTLAAHGVRWTQRIGVGGVNESSILHLDGGHQGVFKPGDGEVEAGRSARPGTYFKREVAASMVAEVMGMGDLVPTTSFRQHGGRWGSMQEFAHNARPAIQLHDARAFDGDQDLLRSSVFDYIMGNSDRHGGNWLVDSVTGKLRLIDNGLSLPTEREDLMHFTNPDLMRQAVRRGLQITPEMKADLRARLPHIIKALSQAGIEPEAIQHAVERFHAVVDPARTHFRNLPDHSKGLENLDHI